MIQQLRDIRAAALEASGIDRSAAVLYAECIETSIENVRDIRRRHRVPGFVNGGLAAATAGA